MKFCPNRCRGVRPAWVRRDLICCLVCISPAPTASKACPYCRANACYTIVGMKSYDVIRVAVDEPGVKAVAAALRVSPALVYKWCEPPADSDDPEQSGAKNPLDRVAEMYQLTKDIRLIRHLCNQAGGFFVSNPQLDARKPLEENIFAETRGMVREFSELLDAVTESVEDAPGIDPDEADEIRQRWGGLEDCVG